MFRNLQLMKVNLSRPINLLDKRTKTVIGKCGYLNVKGETIDVEFNDVSHLPQQPTLELPNSTRNQELEQLFENMFIEMMNEPT